MKKKRALMTLAGIGMAAFLLAGCGEKGTDAGNGNAASAADETKEGAQEQITIQEMLLWTIPEIRTVLVKMNCW